MKFFKIIGSIALTTFAFVGCKEKDVISVSDRGSSDIIRFETSTGLKAATTLESTLKGFKVYGTGGKSPSGWLVGIDGTNNHVFVGNEWGWKDEPESHTNGIALFVQQAQLMKNILPHIKIIATTGNRNEVTPYVDIWVPIFSDHANDYPANTQFYANRQALGEEVWFYTCMFPVGINWISRHVEAPTLNTRYHHWVNYKYGLTGFLYWSFNHWIIWNRTSFSIDNAGGGGWDIPAGDDFVVYPGYRKLYSTIRFAAHRDGIADYELLKLLEKTNKSKAQELVNKLIKGASNYDRDIPTFRNTRRELLEALSQ